MRKVLLCTTALICGNILTHYLFGWSWQQVADTSFSNFLGVIVYKSFWEKS
jgi:hypothetical protein